MEINESASDALTGQWQMVRAELEGDPAHELITANTTLILGNGRYEVRFSGEVADRGTLELFMTASSPTLVLSGQDGPNAGKIIRSIFQLRGNWLRICYGLDGVAPDQFTTAAGTRRYLATYKRAS